jgi:hypothetical protein
MPRTILLICLDVNLLWDLDFSIGPIFGFELDLSVKD